MKRILICILLFGLSGVYAQKKQIEGPLVHSVYFWLTSPNDTAAKLDFENAINKLITTNPQGVSAYLGQPDTTEKRDVVDNSFTYAYIMTFADAEAEAAYQTDPTHLRFIEEAQHLWRKVVVYDAIPATERN